MSRRGSPEAQNAIGTTQRVRLHPVDRLFDEERQALHRQLLDLNPRLAGLYRQAIRLVSEEPPPGEELARYTLIGHAMREFINRLPDVLDDVRGAIARPVRGSADLLRDLDGIADEGSLTGEFVEVPSGTDLQAVMVERTVADLLVRLRQAYRQERLRGEERDAVVVSAARTRGGPAYDQWRAARKFFMDFAHLDKYVGGRSKSLPSEAEVVQALETIERIITVRLTGFFSAREALDRLIDEANSSYGDGVGQFAAPTDAQVLTAVRSLTTLKFRRVFYSQLKNPLWLAPLAAQRAFVPPLSPRPDRKGTRRFDPWPELDYLERVADRVPQDLLPVVRALFKHQEHPWIQRGLVRIAARLPVGVSKAFASTILEWLAHEPETRMDFEDLCNLSFRWLTAGAFKQGDQLGSSLLRPRPDSAATRRVVTTVEEYWYADALAIVMPGFGNRRLEKLRQWLADYDEIASGPRYIHTSDRSYMWRARIATSDGSRSEVGDALVDALRDAAMEAAELDVEFLAKTLLGASASTLERRIAYFGIAAALPKIADSGEGLRELSASLASTTDLRDDGMLPEVTHLLQAISAGLGPGSLEPINGVLRGGPLGSRALLLQRIRQYQPNSDADSVADDYERRWHHRVLIAIGREALPTQFRNQLESLDSRYGVVDEPLPRSFAVADWVHFQGPLPTDAMRAMEPIELMSYLSSWIPPQASRFDGPSRDGLARDLQALTAELPGLFTGLERDLVHLRPIYLRALVDGWAQALKAGLSLPVAAVIALLEMLSGAQEKRSLPEDDSQAEDLPGLTWTTTRALHLVIDWIDARDLAKETSLLQRQALAEQVLEFSPQIPSESSTPRTAMTPTPSRRR